MLPGACRNSSNDDTTKGIKFNTAKWQQKNGREYSYRDSMLTDLINSYELHGIKRDSIIRLFGPPDRIDSNYIFYRVSQKQMGFFTLSAKTFVIKFTADSLLEWRKVHGG